MGDQHSPAGIGIQADDRRSDTRPTLSSSAEPQQQHQHHSRADSGEPAGRPAKRRKESHVRSRVSRACDRCKSRKTRCSGKYPCTLCSQLGLECQYEAAYTRGRLPSIEVETDDRVLQMAATRRHSTPATTTTTTAAARNPGGGGVEDAGALPIPSPISIEHHQLPDVPAAQAPLRLSHGANSTAQSSRNSPEPSQNDQQGHYVGPASGASFLLRIQRKLVHQQSLSSESSIFTFGDLPLPDFDPSFFILPPQADAEALLARYFDFASATHRFLHRPTVEGWLRELYETNGSMRQKATARSRMALLFMVFAQAGNYHKPGMTSREHSSARFFSAAEHQLSAEKGEIRLTSVQARLAQCFWLLGQSRINHCWSLFGTTAHLVLALAYHVQRCLDAATNIVRVVDELTNSGQIFSTYWFTHYFAFCAVVVLYVYVIQQRHSPPEAYLHHFRAAVKCQDQISDIATKGSLAERYGVVLQELRLELLRHNEYLAGQGHAALSLLTSDLVFPVAGSQDHHAPLSAGIPGSDHLGQMGHDAFAEASPSSSIAQLTGWGQFDSLVTGGIGSLETLLADSAAGWDLDLGGNLGTMA
ncbi:Transcription factor [Neofusicoccum parvum]|nr:Transcription factor [Neofusicoccum parvum]